MNKQSVLKNVLLCIALLACYYASNGQQAYWQQKVNYSIAVTLDTAAHTLDGTVKMDYSNNSPDTLHFLWMHLWPNAYKNDRTAFSEQDLQIGKTNFYFSQTEDRGYINRLNFKVDQHAAATEDHPLHQDIVKLILPKPLLPGTQTTIETPFHVKLPRQFSRSGVVLNSYQITQWYPKPAVYDKKGWHEMPYLELGEFYSEFGNYTVTIYTPSNLIIAASGEKTNETINNNVKVSTYQLNNTHDFAWFAASDFLVKHDTLKLATKTINVFAYYYKKNEKLWQNSIAFIKRAVRTKSNWLGEYPYSTVSVVDKKGTNDGGMEYPTITIISSPENEEKLDFLINHEVGHNWFYGILGSNERAFPWMDEGMNTYYDNRYIKAFYQGNIPFVNTSSKFLQKRLPENFSTLGINTLAAIKKDQPIETHSANFSAVNYSLIAYGKAGHWMSMLEENLGTALFDKAMQDYYNQWKFKHPQPEDFKQSMEQTSGKNLDALFGLLHKKGSLDTTKPKKLKLTSFFNLKETDKYHYISLMPAIGFNQYDKLMAGLILHNYSLPPQKLQFIGTALYGMGSSKLNSIGRVGYSIYPNQLFDKVVLSVNWESFSSQQSKDTLLKKTFERFSKIAPAVRFYFSEKAQSSFSTWLELKTYLIRENNFSAYYFITGSDSLYTYPAGHTSDDRYINQITFSKQNFRKLYPYRYQLQIQQGKGFYRFNATADYFFNYAKGGGLQARFFAAKFGYLGQKNYYTYIYQPKLLGGTGYDDYTYAHYFIGRSASSANADFPVANKGLGARQIMVDNTGGLKLRMDKYPFLQGQSDDWVAAVNLRSSLPSKLFPIKLPLYVFLDIGTYAEAWNKDHSTGRFLYTAGLQVSLFKDLLTISAPLLLSKEFRNTLKTDPEENKFFKKITFSISFKNLTPRMIHPQIPL